MIRRTSAPPAPTSNSVAAAAFAKLNREDLGASEWYLYTYLSGLCQLKGSNPFRTAIHQLRSPAEYKGLTVQPCKMAVNTMKASLEMLEESGLISVHRTEDGRVVHLDITIN